MVARNSESALDSSLVPGYRLDRYELLCPIASGGMASVWLAQLRAKRGFEKLFAVKTIRTELIADPRFQDMFLDEARLASRIEHPNIAQILDLGEQDEILYTVMEWVDGESLAKIQRTALQRGTPIPPGVALRIMSDALAGLQAAHDLKDDKGSSLGVVHRDVSPQNILVTSSGAVKVIDFGVAKAKDRLARDTSGGAVKGKIHYLAPEQTHPGAEVDHRADLWAAAICLYELVTGKEPYGDLGDADVLRKLMSDDPTPRLSGLPERLVPIVPILDRALARHPAGRYESAAAMRRAFLGAMDELGLTSSSEETADFLRTHLSDLEKRRRARVSRAIEAAKGREQAPDSQGRIAPAAPASISGDDLDAALAPTMAGDPSVTPSPPEEAKTTAPSTLSEQIARPTGRRLETALIAGAVIAVAVVIVIVLRVGSTREPSAVPTTAASTASPSPSTEPMAQPTSSAPEPPSAKAAPPAIALPKLPSPTPSATTTSPTASATPTEPLTASAAPSVEAGAPPAPSASSEPAPTPSEEETH